MAIASAEANFSAAFAHTREAGFRLADGLWSKIDVGLIDAAVNGVGRAFAWWGWLMRLWQTGQAQHYALAMTAGAVVILTVYLIF